MRLAFKTAFKRTNDISTAKQTTRITNKKLIKVTEAQQWAELLHNCKERKVMIMMNNAYIPFTIGKQKRIALIAHDGKKQELIDWCDKNKEILQKHFLCGTGTTARLIAEHTGLPVKGYNSGPLGGDQQIGAKIVEGGIDLVVFFSDPLEAQPHDPDVKALLRIAQVYDIPMANNKSTADFIITSSYMNTEYVHEVLNFKQNIENRVKSMQ